MRNSLILDFEYSHDEVLNGQHDALNAFFKIAHPLCISSVIKSYNIKFEDAEEIFMSALEEILRKRPEVNDTKHLLNILINKTKNKVIDLIRSRNTKKRNFNQNRSLDLLKESGDIFMMNACPTSFNDLIVSDNGLSSLEKKEQDKKVSNAMDTIDNPSEKCVLYNRLIKQLSFKEISEICSVKIGSVGSMLARALDKVRKKLA